MATEAKVVKIYELKTVGYEDVLENIRNLQKEFDKAKAKYQEMKRAFAGSQDFTAEFKKQEATVNALNIKLQEQAAIIQKLQAGQAQQAAQQQKAGKDQLSLYKQLTETYKQAVAAAKETAVQFGAQSTQAKAAAANAQKYKEQLRQINDVVKQGATGALTGTAAKTLSREQALAAESTKKLNQEIRQQTREALAAANSLDALRARLAVLTSKRNKLDIDSSELEKANAEILELNTRIKQIEQAGGDFRRNVGNYQSGFDGVRNSINQLTREAPAFANSIQTGFLALSNNIPIFFDEISRARKEIQTLRAQGEQVPGLFQRIAGSIFSFGTLLSVGVTLLTIYGKEIVEFVGALFRGRTAMDQFTERQRLLNKALTEDGGLKDAVKNINELRINIDLAKAGIISKEGVLKQYNETIGETTGQVTSLDQAERELVKNGDAYIRMMLLKAAAQLALEDAAKKALEAEQNRRKEEAEFLTAGDRLVSFGARSSGVTPGGGFVPGQFNQNQQIAAASEREQGARRKKEAVDDLQKQSDDFLAVAKKFQEEAGKIAKDSGFNFFTPDKKTETGTKLDNSTQEALKLIDERKNLLLAAARTEQNEIARQRKVTLDEEVAYLQRIRDINAAALQESIALLSRKKSLNAEERQTLAQFREDLSQIYLDTSTKIQGIEKKRFEDAENILQRELDAKIAAAERERDLLLENPELSAQGRAQAQLEANQAVFEAQRNFLLQLEQLNSDYNQEALARAREALENTEQQLRTDRRTFTLAEVEDIRRAGEEKVRQTNIDYSKLRQAILNNEKLSQSERKRQLELLDQAERRTVLSAELEQLNAEVRALESLLEQGLISREEYLKKVEEQNKKAEEVAAASESNTAPVNRGFRTVGQLLQGGRSGRGGLRSVLGIEEGSDEDQLLGQVISKSYDAAQEAMNGYFDAEERRIRQNLGIQQERLRIEEEQALRRATTQQEEERIRRDFDAKKRAEEKKAGEQLKKIRIAEARVALATELANIAAAAASNPANGVTFGGAGAIMYGVLSAAAFARYFLNVSNIQRQVFEKGGTLRSSDVPADGGPIGGKPHGQGGAPFAFNGKQYEAEVDELSIIRTKNAPRSKVFSITGNQSQIASALNEIGGGRRFSPGARVRSFQFGGQLGESLQPPVFTPSVSSASVANFSSSTEELRGLREDVVKLAQEQAARIDRLEVYQVTSTVTAAQSKAVSQQNIATL